MLATAISSVRLPVNSSASKNFDASATKSHSVVRSVEID